MKASVCMEKTMRKLAQLATFSDQSAEDEWFEYLRTGRLKRFDAFEKV